MQGHPESPRLWEKHADKILQEIGLTPTVHEPCLYSGVINDQWVLFMQQVNDFSIAAPAVQTADILMDLIDDKLKIPIKRQGYLDKYNGVDMQQTRYYIKISLKTYFDKIFEPYFATWMKMVYPTPACWTPLPSDHAWLKKFNAAVGDPDDKVQAQLATSMQLTTVRVLESLFGL